jgi:hypothetical protein
VNVPLTANALTLVSNPLKPSNGNFNITNTISLPDTADGANLYSWNGTSWDSASFLAGAGWLPDSSIPLGKAFFIQSPIATTVTFVGEVATGTISTTFNPGLNVVANQVPVAEPYPGSTVGNDGDNIYLWNGSAWATTWSFLAGLGWTAGGANDDVNGPVLPVGGGAVYQNTTATPLTWSRAFNP